jgi:diacylglycerol kinase (ATP)
MKKTPKYKLIYNPKAGKKRHVIKFSESVSLEDIFALLQQYQIEYDAYPTSGPGDATKLAQAAHKEGYSCVLAAGGDGTVGEVINGLVGTEVKLGILPLGTYMNIARMLSIPLDLEKAIEVIKIERTRKIDVGCITKIDGDKLLQPYYFVESMAVGMEAQFQENFVKFDSGKWSALIDMYKTISDYYWDSFTLTLDKKVTKVRASMIRIANGPFSGAALETDPHAKLNDHILSIAVFRMSNWDLIRYFAQLLGIKIAPLKKKQMHRAQSVEISSKHDRPVHADARVFGTTPISIKVLPSAITMICGFPKPHEKYLGKRTLLDP